MLNLRVHSLLNLTDLSYILLCHWAAKIITQPSRLPCCIFFLYWREGAVTAGTLTLATTVQKEGTSQNTNSLLGQVNFLSPSWRQLSFKPPLVQIGGFGWIFPGQPSNWCLPCNSVMQCIHRQKNPTLICLLLCSIKILSSNHCTNQEAYSSPSKAAGF